MLNREERTGMQDIISRNELALTNCRDEQNRKKTKWGHEKAAAVRSDGQNSTEKKLKLFGHGQGMDSAKTPVKALLTKITGNRRWGQQPKIMSQWAVLNVDLMDRLMSSYRTMIRWKKMVVAVVLECSECINRGFLENILGSEWCFPGHRPSLISPKHFYVLAQIRKWHGKASSRWWTSCLSPTDWKHRKTQLTKKCCLSEARTRLHDRQMCRSFIRPHHRRLSSWLHLNYISDSQILNLGGALASEGWWEAWQPSPKVTRR